ncbi:MAG: hypothetical protein DLM66_12840 [Candidatus Dormiibacter spiritus]|nr:MAG: hypothetical protein DLM66_12840 [Candidatus Dormibacteraeota bacterium]
MSTRIVGGLAVTLLLVGCADAGGPSSPARHQGSGAASNGQLAQASSVPGAACHYRQVAGNQTLPDSSCTPGATNPAVTQADIGSTICVRGWTKTIRPPASETEPQKRKSMRRYGATGSAGDFEFDHLISLELGGAPDDQRNLWPEPGASPNAKDGVERALNQAVCTRRLTLIEAQRRITADWTTATQGVA